MLFDDTYKTLAQKGESLFRDRGSKFIGYAFPLVKEEEIQIHLNELRKQHPSARHFCYAWRMGADMSSYRANDDGEPAGSAGKPIYNQIQSAGITQALVVVVRYFGGTLLGVSGLIQAYKTAAADAIASAGITEKTIEEVYEVKFSYASMNDVMKILKDHKLAAWEQDFGLDCKLKAAIRKSEADDLLAQLRNCGCECAYLFTR